MATRISSSFSTTSVTGGAALVPPSAHISSTTAVPSTAPVPSRAAAEPAAGQRRAPVSSTAAAVASELAVPATVVGGVGSVGALPPASHPRSDPVATGQATTPYSWLIFGGRGFCARLQTVPRTQIRTVTDSPFSASLYGERAQHAALAVPRPGLFVCLQLVSTYREGGGS